MIANVTALLAEKTAVKGLELNVDVEAARSFNFALAQEVLEEAMDSLGLRG